MPTPAVLLPANHDSTNATIYTTEALSRAPVAGRPLLLCIGVAAAAAHTGVASVTGAGVTWSQVAGADLEYRTAGRRRQEWWIGEGATPTADALTITLDAAGIGIMVSITEFEDSSGFGTPGTGTGTGTAGALDAALGAMAGDSGTFFSVMVNTNEAITQDTAGGWSELSSDGGVGPTGAHSVGWNDGQDTTPTATWATSDDWGVIAVEVLAAGGGGASGDTKATAGSRSTGVEAKGATNATAARDGSRSTTTEKKATSGATAARTGTRSTTTGTASTPQAASGSVTSRAGARTSSVERKNAIGTTVARVGARSVVSGRKAVTGAGVSKTGSISITSGSSAEVQAESGPTSSRAGSRSSASYAVGALQGVSGRAGVRSSNIAKKGVSGAAQSRQGVRSQIDLSTGGQRRLEVAWVEMEITTVDMPGEPTESHVGGRSSATGQVARSGPTTSRGGGRTQTVSAAAPHVEHDQRSSSGVGSQCVGSKSVGFVGTQWPGYSNAFGGRGATTGTRSTAGLRTEIFSGEGGATSAPRRLVVAWAMVEMGGANQFGGLVRGRAAARITTTGRRTGSGTIKSVIGHKSSTTGTKFQPGTHKHGPARSSTGGRPSTSGVPIGPPVKGGGVKSTAGSTSASSTEQRVVSVLAAGPAVKNVTHLFTPLIGAPRVLPVSGPGVLQQRVGDMEATGEAPAGYLDAQGKISVEEMTAHPNIYTYGTEWRMLDDDGDVFWSGVLKKPSPKPDVDGKVQLSGIGWGHKPDKVFERMMWLSADMDLWSTADAEPFNYDVDVDQIEAKVEGSEMRFIVAHKAVFLRATGKTTLASDALKDDEFVEIEHNSGGLKDGERITIGDETKIVKNTYSPGSTSVPLTEGLNSKHDKGTKVSWRASNNPEFWSTGMVAWTPTSDIRGVMFKLRISQTTDEYDLQLLAANGPSGNLEVIRHVNLSQGEGLGNRNKKQYDLRVPAGHDLVMLRLRRKSQTDKARRFKAELTEVFVRGLAPDDDYKTHSVASDIFDKVAPSWPQVVKASNRKALPVDAENVSAGIVLDEISALDDWRWLALDKEWHYGPWNTNVWTFPDELPPDLIPVDPINEVTFPFRYGGGYMSFKRVTADPNPLPGGIKSTKHIDWEEPPPEAIATTFAQNILPYLAEERYSGSADFTQIMNGFGDRFIAHKLRPGDVLKIEGRNQRVSQISYFDDRVSASFPDGHPLLDRLLARRKRLLAIGKGQAQATLGGLGLDEPMTPAGTIVGFEEMDARGGRRDFDALLDWEPVEQDILGNYTAIDRYIVEWRYELPDGSHRGRDQKIVKAQRGDDDPNDPIPTRVRIRNILHPHKWKIQFRLRAQDVLDKESQPTPWSDAKKPANFGPPTPQNLVVDVDQHRMHADIDLPDVDEVEADDLTPIFDRRVATIRWKRFRRRGSNPYTKIGKTARGKQTEMHWGVKQPRNDDFKVEVVTVDHYGNVSPVVSQVTQRRTPPAPALPPTLSFGKGGKGGIRAFINFSYGGTYADDDISGFVVQFQDEENNPLNSDPKRQRIHALQKDELASDPQSVLFRRVKRNDRCRARYAAVDHQNRVGAFSDWCNIKNAVPSRRPGQPRNVRKHRAPRTITWRWDPPASWTGGSSVGWSDSEVSHYDVTVVHNGVVDEDRSDHVVKAQKHQVTIPRGSSGWRINIAAKGHDDDSSDTLVYAPVEADEALVVNLDDTTGTLDLSRLNVSVGTLTGARIRTAASGARVSMRDSSDDNDAINFYGAGGQRRGVIRADAGDFQIKAPDADFIRMEGARVRFSLAPHFDQTSNFATGGGGDPTPNAVRGYVNVRINGVDKRVPYYDAV